MFSSDTLFDVYSETSCNASYEPSAFRLFSLARVMAREIVRWVTTRSYRLLFRDMEEHSGIGPFTEHRGAAMNGLSLIKFIPTFKHHRTTTVRLPYYPLRTPRRVNEPHGRLSPQWGGYSTRAMRRWKALGRILPNSLPGIFFYRTLSVVKKTDREIGRAPGRSQGILRYMGDRPCFSMTKRT